MKWKSIKGQVLASTHLDRQGERVDKAFLDKLCSNFSKHKRLPLNQSHDMALQDVGYIENFAVVKDESGQEEWCLIGDVHFHDVDIDDALKGFSYSITDDLKGDYNKREIGIYLPYPYYNDEDFLLELAQQESGIVAGAWRRKAADPATISLIISFALFVSAPAYTNFWNNKISPSIDKLLSKIGSNGTVEFAQVGEGHLGESFAVYFIPVKGQEHNCFLLNNVISGMDTVRRYVENDSLSKEKGIYIVRLKFDESLSLFKLFQIHYLDGSLVYI